MVIFFVLICIVGIVLLPYWLIPAKPFPQPSGKWQVGTSNINWNSANHAGIIAKVWYPTNATTGIKSHYSAGALLTDGTQVKFNPIKPEVFADVDLFELALAPLTVEQASNLSMVLDTIIGLNSTIDSFLYQKINTGRIFVAGHSLGGAASFIACGKDRRIAKGVDFDGALIFQIYQ